MKQRTEADPAKQTSEKALWGDMIYEILNM
jgi:hypothetical protein